MVTSARLGAIAALALLAACTRPVDDPLAVHSIYWGLDPMPVYDGPLPQVLWSAPGTPAKQSLLYTAMVDAEVAAQYAGRALAAEDATSVRTALGELLFAIDPEVAPDWQAKETGIVRGWAGTGYGLQRAATGMAAQIRAAAAEDDAPTVLAQAALPAARCADNALQWSARIVVLTREAAAAAALEADPLLQQIQELATQLNQGSLDPVGAAPADPQCGLGQAVRFLEPLAPRRS